MIVALSDLLVLTALERSWARTRRRPAGSRANNPPAATRHLQYMTEPVPMDRLDQALRDAWALCPLIATRHDLDVDVVEWMGLLDSYTRALLMMSEPHYLPRLAEHLANLPGADAWADTDAG